MNIEMFKKRGSIFFKLTDWALKKGYIQHRGFSSHDTPENIKEFIDTGEFSVMLVSYNWLNPYVRDAIEYAADKGMGVSIMNPVGGGTLSADTPQIRNLLRGAKTSAEVSLRYALATPGVSLVFSGMNTPEQVTENTAIAFRKNPMTPKQWQEMNRKLKNIKAKGLRFCTGCGYCMPCPHGVDIPANFRFMNQARLFGLVESARNQFGRLRNHKDGDKSAFACKNCGRCIPKCPNNIPIIDQLVQTAEYLGE
jgi:predicted aldo/keto reductase-like oxidoreductase